MSMEQPPQSKSAVRRYGASVSNFAQSVSLIVVLIIAWEFSVRIFDISPAILPPPTRIVEAFQIHADEILFHSYITLIEVIAGFAIGTAVGLTAGVLIYYVDYFRRTLYPFFTLLYIVPKASFAPLLIIWFGTGMTSKVFLAVLLVLFPVLVNTYSGLMEIDEEMLDMARSCDASEWFIFWRIRLPYASPFILASLKLGIIFAIIGAVVAEFIAANLGIGALVIGFQTYAQTSATIASIVTVIIMSLVLYYLVYFIEQRLLFWYVEE